MMNAFEVLQRACELQVSDIHLSAGAPVSYRIDGELIYEGNVCTREMTEFIAREIVPTPLWDKVITNGEVDFAYGFRNTAQFRVNVYRQQGSISIAARRIPSKIPSCEDIALPETVISFTSAPFGLVLVTGPTGSGKSTTLASMIQYINQTRRSHVITLEDPIEYLYTHQLSIIDQREIGVDTYDFASALRAALRQDPDIILIGEMRDPETIAAAITAAETGHLVFATLHTSNTVQSIDRMIDVFPPMQQDQIRFQLSMVLRGIVSQRLHKRCGESGRVASFEILVNTPAVANLIRTQKIHQILSLLQTGHAYGMQTMAAHIKQLVDARVIAESAIYEWENRLQETYSV